MCDALVELMEDYVEEQIEERMEQRVKEQLEERVKEERETGIKSLICFSQNMGISRKDTMLQLSAQYRLAEESAEEYVKKYWKE